MLLPALQYHIRKLGLPRRHVCFDCDAMFHTPTQIRVNGERMRDAEVPMTLKRLTGSAPLPQDGCATGHAAKTIKGHEELGGYGNLSGVTIVG